MAGEGASWRELEAPFHGTFPPKGPEAAPKRSLSNQEPQVQRKVVCAILSCTEEIKKFKKNTRKRPKTSTKVVNAGLAGSRRSAL